MNQHERELIVARICSGSVRLRVHDDTFIIRKPTAEQLYIGHEIYAEYLQRASLAGLYNDGELMKFLLDHSFWDVTRNKLLETLPKEIDQFKVALFKSQFKSKEKGTIRKFLATAKSKMSELQTQRGMYDFLSCSGAAALARSKYLIGSSTFRNDSSTFHKDSPVFDHRFWEQDSNLLDEVMNAYAKSRIDEVSLREIARHDPWRSIWSTHKIENSLFGQSAIEYTEEQRSLALWSNHYDNIYAHPNCPSDEVIADDDVLDGWAIEQKRLRDAAMNQSAADDVVKNEKIRNSQEVYLVADTHEDARKIDALNTEVGSVTKKQRFQALAKAGELNEMEMPDTVKRLRQEVTKRLSAAMSG